MIVLLKIACAAAYSGAAALLIDHRYLYAFAVIPVIYLIQWNIKRHKAEAHEREKL